MLGIFTNNSSHANILTIVCPYAQIFFLSTSTLTIFADITSRLFSRYAFFLHTMLLYLLIVFGIFLLRLIPVNICALTLICLLAQISFAITFYFRLGFNR